jgi:hypothetical protein
MERGYAYGTMGEQITIPLGGEVVAAPPSSNNGLMAVSRYGSQCKYFLMAFTQPLGNYCVARVLKHALGTFFMRVSLFWTTNTKMKPKGMSDSSPRFEITLPNGPVYSHGTFTGYPLGSAQQQPDLRQ